MKKICILTPCLMLDNNREVNMKYINSNIEQLNADKHIIYAQCFTENDYAMLDNSKIDIIGRKDKPQGFVAPRNELLEYFYESDYDYAFWIDANSCMTSTTMNTYYTVLDALRNEKIDVDAIFSSLGIIASQERMSIAAMPDYFDVVKLLPAGRYGIRNLSWLHGCFMKNLNKYYGKKLFMNPECDPWKGTVEDAYFSTLLRQCCNCYLCPSIVVSKPSAKTSTWMKDSKDSKGNSTYGYPPVQWNILEEWAKEATQVVNSNKGPYNIIEIPRVDKMRNLLQEYKSRKKVPENTSKINLF